MLRETDQRVKAVARVYAPPCRDTPDKCEAGSIQAIAFFFWNGSPICPGGGGSWQLIAKGNPVPSWVRPAH